MHINQTAAHPAGAIICAACTGKVDGGRAGCQKLFDTYCGLAFENLRYSAVHTLLVDAYCMQHLIPYCVSAKSYAAHLAGLCLGVEGESNPTTYFRIASWLNGPRVLERPATLPHLGSITLANVAEGADADSHAERVRSWAAEVWRAYTPQHELARAWLRQALGGEGPGS